MRVAVIFTLMLIPMALLAFQPAHASLVPEACYKKGGKCGLCEFTQLGTNILNFLVMVGSVLAALGFALGGFKLLTSAGNPGQIAAAKATLTNVLIGLIILLAAWLIVDTVIKVLVLDGQQLGPWNTASC